MLAARTSFGFGLVAFVLISAFTAAQANDIVNGSFESGPALSPGQFTPLTAGQLPGWTLEGLSPSNPSWYWYFSNNPTYGVAEDGTRFVNLSIGTPLSQSFAVGAGNTYTVSYYEALRGDGAGQPDTITSSVSLASGSATGTTSQVANNPLPNSSISNWEQFSFSFTPNTNTTATLQFALTPGMGYAGYPVLDHVSVTSTPEPRSLVLFGLGLIGLLVAAVPRRTG